TVFLMAYASDNYSPLVRRRTALRAVPPPSRHVAAEPLVRVTASPAEEEGLLETHRKLWRRRGLIALCTVVIGGAAVVAAWLLPPYYVSEARVLVGVANPRLPNVDSILADVSPDAERVQNEGFIIQSRSIAKQVIDQLRLRDDPEFNPQLRKPSFWARLDLGRFVPAAIDAWISRVTSSKAPNNEQFGGFSTRA